MAEAITLQAVDAIALRLQQITVANGFRTDAGQSVHTEPQQLPAGAGPRLTVWMDRVTLEQVTNDLREWRMQIIVEAEAASTHTTSQRQAHAVMADVFQVFPSMWVRLQVSGRELDVFGEAAEFRARIDGSLSSIAEVRLQAVIRESAT